MWICMTWGLGTEQNLSFKEVEVRDGSADYRTPELPYV